MTDPRRFLQQTWVWRLSPVRERECLTSLQRLLCLAPLMPARDLYDKNEDADPRPVLHPQGSYLSRRWHGGSNPLPVLKAVFDSYLDCEALSQEDPIVSLNMPRINIHEFERAIWKSEKIRMRGGGPYKIRLPTPCYLQKAEIDRFLEKFDTLRKSYKT